ncbi:hypothetical protein HNP67_001043 [Borreliella californiensis]|uniref:Uncharacterized protein n=1 Tax=Borreliella californiensis TaxID=373543 RepID=A0A7W9ZL46_9SPIR|nr:hypothetical protein [Borreliella californiensis]MBB6213548.1 hypothetical protein [Borreliella californiensis]
MVDDYFSVSLEMRINNKKSNKFSIYSAVVCSDCL